jgi:2-polyprenyl-6-methoxyphenol hydroxylase-like FAD-dependent oxidoreductase
MTTDVVVVGGGIAGASVAFALARSGVRVVVLEATERFTDKVRGESMMPWGVAEAEQLGVADVLRRAGAHTSTRWTRYGEGLCEPSQIPVGLLVSGVPGALNLHHPTACRALLDAARDAGAEVWRGVRDVRLAPSGAPTAEFHHEGGIHRIAGHVVIGADGRASSVRQQLGLDLHHTQPTAAIVGLLVEGLSEPEAGAHDDVVLETDQGMGLLLHQGGGRARAYHVVPLDDRANYAGAVGAEALLADLRAGRPEVRELLADATPAGPCASFPNFESWIDLPAHGSVVLIGDAAGQSDPTIGCGLSVAMRDARTVRDLILGGATTATDFATYGAQRADLLRRLRLIAQVMIASVVAPGDDRSARRAWLRSAMAAMDPDVFPVIVGMFAGPESIPTGLVESGVSPSLGAGSR